MACPIFAKGQAVLNPILYVGTNPRFRYELSILNWPYPLLALCHFNIFRFLLRQKLLHTIKPRYSEFQETGQNHALYQGFTYCQHVINYENTSWDQNLHAHMAGFHYNLKQKK